MFIRAGVSPLLETLYSAICVPFYYAPITVCFGIVYWYDRYDRATLQFSVRSSSCRMLPC